MVEKGEMPPAKNPKLTAEQVVLIKGWINRGAPAVEQVIASRPPIRGTWSRKATGR